MQDFHCSIISERDPKVWCDFKDKENIPIEVVDDDEFEAIEISLRLAEKIYHVNRQKCTLQAPKVSDLQDAAAQNSNVEARVSTSISLTKERKIAHAAPHLEAVNARSEEYEAVKLLFSKSCRNHAILSIERSLQSN